GYGKTPGTPSPDHLYEDALLLLDHVSHGYRAEQIVLYGRSLGSAPATRLAAEGRAKSLILETPFDNLHNLFQAYMPLQQWSVQPAFDLPNDAYLRQTPLPVLIFHGTRDRVVPYASAARLKPLLKPNDLFVTIPGGSHHNLGESPLYADHLAAWLR
ncbi:MAG: alpha/beta hydrolase, partial [Saprospiraceae bacterium]